MLIYVRSRFRSRTRLLRDYFESALFVEPNASMTLIRSMFRGRAFGLRPDALQASLADSCIRHEERQSNDPLPTEMIYILAGRAADDSDKYESC